MNAASFAFTFGVILAATIGWPWSIGLLIGWWGMEVYRRLYL